MSNYHQPPPLPPSHDNGSIPNSAPSGQPNYPPLQEYAHPAQHSNVYVNPQYPPHGYTSQEPSASSPPTTVAPAAYYPPPPGTTHQFYPPPPPIPQNQRPPPPPPPQQQQQSYHISPATSHAVAHAAQNNSLQSQSALCLPTPPQPATDTRSAYGVASATTAFQHPSYQQQDTSLASQASGTYHQQQYTTIPSHHQPHGSVISSRPPVPRRDVAISTYPQPSSASPEGVSTGGQLSQYNAPPPRHPQSTGYQQQYSSSSPGSSLPHQQAVSLPNSGYSVTPTSDTATMRTYPHPPGSNISAAPPPTQLQPQTGQAATIPPPVPRRKPVGQSTNAPTLPPRDALLGLSSQMNNLNIATSSHGPSPQLPARTLDDNSPRPPPVVRATGDPQEVIPYCPESRVVDYSLFWYRLLDVPDVMICTKCHADYIQGTRLSDQFEKTYRPNGTYSQCRFWFPRVKEVLWPYALRTGELGALRAFMKKRIDVKACKGQAPTPASDGIKWFSTRSNEINGFVTCEACYEDRIVGTHFEARFTPHAAQKTDEKWSCDLAVPYMARAVVKMAKHNDWAGFVASVSRRMTLPKCEDKQVQSTGGSWYMPRQKMENIVACEACYMDKLALTRFEREFVPYKPASGLDSFIQHFTQLWTCQLTATNLPIAIALESAIEQRDWSVFRTSLELICRLVPCTANGIIRGKWWTIAGGCENFDICESCYVGILRTNGLSHFFEPARWNIDQTMVCDFCVASPRFSQYIIKYAEAMDKGVFSYYTDYVKKFAAVPVCPRLQTAEKVKWWGYPEALFCQDCYMSFVDGTSLAKSVPLKGVYDERKQICQIWSSRMRGMWIDVCAAGAPGSSELNTKLAEFCAFGTKRLQIYLQTIPQIDFIRNMKIMKMNNAMHQGLLSVMYNGMDGLAQVSGTTDGHLHGNSQVGWYETEQGAQGAQMFNNMQAGFANANRVDEWMQMAQLEMVWKQVE